MLLRAKPLKDSILNRDSSEVYKKFGYGGFDQDTLDYLNEFAKWGKSGGVTTSPGNNGSMSSAVDALGTVGNYPTPPEKSGFDYTGVMKDVAPYLSNVVNRFRKIPKPAAPNMEQYIRANEVSYDADRNALNTALRTTTAGLDTRVANPTIAQALKADAFAKLIEGNNQLAQQERNTNAQINNQVAGMNSMIGARNTERANAYKNEQVARDLAQMNFDAENFANFSDKVQMQQRDKAQFDLEARKIGLLPAMYGDTGVFGRNLTTQQLAALRKQGITDKQLKELGYNV